MSKMAKARKVVKTFCSPTLQNVGVVMKNETRCAQRHSKVSEWLSKMAHKTHKTHRTRITKIVLCSGGVQSIGIDCSHWPHQLYNACIQNQRHGCPECR
ncbi:MAG: hypothetical protein WC721_08655 [Victivallaceae bacterium]